MAETKQVRIVGWPQDPLAMAHQFAQDDLVPVTISFAETPAHVRVATEPGRPLQVNMDMALRALEQLPLCLTVCEPLCAESEYTIGITVFDRPIITITIRGRTRLFGENKEM